MNNTFELVEENAVDAPVENIKWYGKDVETERKDLIDKPEGETVNIRSFVFKLPMNEKPKQEELLTPQALNFIKAQLWGDGWKQVSEPQAKVMGDGYVISVACVPTMGNSVLEQPKNIWTTIKIC